MMSIKMQRLLLTKTTAGVNIDNAKNNKYCLSGLNPFVHENHQKEKEQHQNFHEGEALHAIGWLCRKPCR
jgi:hypothetical protein